MDDKILIPEVAALFEECKEEITVAELMLRLSCFPPDTVLITEQYDYYVDLIRTRDTFETVWKP